MYLAIARWFRFYCCKLLVPHTQPNSQASVTDLQRLTEYYIHCSQKKKKNQIRGQMSDCEASSYSTHYSLFYLTWEKNPLNRK